MVADYVAAGNALTAADTLTIPRDVKAPGAEFTLAYAEAVHEAFSDLHGVAARGSDARLVVDAHADQRRSC